MKIFTEPFIHAIVTPPAEIYEYAKHIYPVSPTLIPGYRTNLDIVDDNITRYIDSVVDEAYNTFLPNLQEEYPKMDFNTLSKRSRYLFSHNTPSLNPNVIRGLHLDNGTKIIVGLWYFKDDEDTAGGDLYLMNPITKKSTIFKYDSNKLIIFPNIITAWHAVTKRNSSAIPRKFINIILESDVFLHSYNKIGITEPKNKVVNNFK